MRFLKKIVKSRTMWLAVGIAGLGALEQQIMVIPEDYRGYALIVISILVAALRFATTQPISEK